MAGPLMHRFGIVLVGLALLIALLADLLGTHDPYVQDLLHLNALPSAAHWLGQDSFGRDIFSRLLLGTRLSLLIGGGATFLALLIGAGIGLPAVALGPRAEYLVFGFIDLVRAMPGMLLAMTLMVALNVGTGSVILALGIAYSPFFARIARAAYLREMAATYVAAARTLGGARLRILRRHVVPNILGALVTQVAIVLPRAITTESVLSFFGLGVSPETPTWGRMIAAASSFTEVAPHTVLIPVLALSCVTLGFSLVGDRLRRQWDPLRAGGEA